MDRTHETLYCKYGMVDGILFCLYKPIAYITLEIARNIVSSRLHFQENEAFLVFCDTRGIKDSSKPARDYLAREGSTLVKALVIFDDRNLSTHMLRYYLFRNKPSVPTAIFKEKEKALEFLKSNSGYD
ncbi:DUF7793 family protein [Aequorivita marina]|uniref:DUF7793 family protein n=1 Tax=Aequorivita marina TaxID=3073654 RepID=UPI002875F22C|nr:hypothetical protein [Aequorivita sp. S2608]MDS1299098.1 hypothetical protein [Aequorivita sp. S2608]